MYNNEKIKNYNDDGIWKNIYSEIEFIDDSIPLNQDKDSFKIELKTQINIFFGEQMHI
jgi:hypothetical protein